MRKQGNVLILVLLLIIGAWLGGVLGRLAGGAIPLFAETLTVGLTPPLQLNLGFFGLTFGFLFALNPGAMLGLLLALLFFRRL